MSKIWLVGIAAIGLLTVCAPLARATDISAKKIFIKDNADPAKRAVQVQSADPAVLRSPNVDAATNGAAIHGYSATDDFCVILPGGADWQVKPTKVKYKNKATKNAAQVKDGKLSVKIKSISPVITYTLIDNGTQGTVNAQVQFGTGPRYCLRCSPPNKKDEATKFFGKDCVAAACDAEPSTCDALAPTTTSSTSTTSTSTTTSTTGTTLGSVLKAVLPSTSGRFNYNLSLGLPGADAACNLVAPGSHHCTYAELQAAETAGDLVGIKDTNNVTVTSFWAIDNSHNVQVQCIDDTVGGSNQNWEYATAHTGTAGEKVNLTNGTGVLGPLMSGFPDNVFCAGSSWVGCCQ